MRYRCPVCMFPSLPYPPRNYHICPCCSTEFGNDDADFSHQQLREMWIGNRAPWFFGNPPAHWNPWTQLMQAGLASYVPKEFHAVSFQSSVVVRQTVARNILLANYSSQNLPRIPVAA